LVSIVDDEARAVPVPAHAGDCATCAHARAIANRRGSVFVLCARATSDTRFARYPRLPVAKCPGREQPSA
jgi:hypothetical protein